MSVDWGTARSVAAGVILAGVVLGILSLVVGRRS
jgi:hypothetical protein